MKYKYLRIAIFPFVAMLFLSVLPFMNAQTDTTVISMQGENWQLKVDSILQTSLESKSIPYISTTEKGEKELFLQLNSLEDCKTGIIQFKVQTTGLTVYKQLPLNQEIELKEGEIDFVNATHAMLKEQIKVYRPENVVNSFACFDDSEKKVLHIYASKLIDANGQSVWVDSDLKDGLLTVYLDNNFLETAKFPVILDPTFGFTSVGASTANAQTTVYACRYQLTEQADPIHTISLYCQASGNGNVRLGLYNDSSGSPNAKVAEDQDNAVTNSYAWVNGTIEYDAVAGYYWLGFSSVDETTFNIKYDSGVSGQTAYNWDYGYLDNPFGSEGTENWKISIYVDYTAYVEPTPTPTPTAEPTTTPTSTPTPTEFTSTETWNIIILLVMLIVGLILALKRTLPILNFVFGMFAIAISAWTLTIAPYFGGLLQLAVIIIGIIVMVSGYKEAY